MSLPPVRRWETALSEAIIDQARRYGCYGYRQVSAFLQADGWQVNQKRVERL